MKYVVACFLALIVSGCAEHHELTACQGPYNALTPPPAALQSFPAGKPQTQAAR